MIAVPSLTERVLTWTPCTQESSLELTDATPDETTETASTFLRNAIAAFAARGVTIQRVLTDNGSCYRSRAFAAVLAEAGIRHKRTKPYRP